ncbi:hypothetical protein PVAP13_1NG035700 [Panicum virgatum]|uniref:Uncharacterized protein n=1 Tax=Panicum virgatum TaxID=38727 RepID=A0A8T0WT79_PANVG|nr:hypothetical protein PVAP13_1NG035700 [Panicum virgatum]
MEEKARAASADFISSSPAVPLPAGVTDSATVLPMPTPGQQHRDDVGMGRRRRGGRRGPHPAGLQGVGRAPQRDRERLRRRGGTLPEEAATSMASRQGPTRRRRWRLVWGRASGSGRRLSCPWACWAPTQALALALESAARRARRRHHAAPGVRP